MNDGCDFNNADIIASKEETEKRVQVCIACNDNVMLNMVPSCNHCNCSISIMTTLTFKECPLGKW